jgi:hypothetical protein
MLCESIIIQCASYNQPITNKLCHFLFFKNKQGLTENARYRRVLTDFFFLNLKAQTVQQFSFFFLDRKREIGINEMVNRGSTQQSFIGHNDFL